MVHVVSPRIHPGVFYDFSGHKLTNVGAGVTDEAFQRYWLDPWFLVTAAGNLCGRAPIATSPDLYYKLALTNAPVNGAGDFQGTFALNSLLNTSG